MKYRLLCSIISLFLSSIWDDTPLYTNKPISISGSTNMVEIGELIPIHLSMIDGHPYAYINVKIYVDDNLEIDQNVITEYLDETEFSLMPFSKYNQKRKVKIVINYVDDLYLDDSIANFEIYSPTNKTISTGSDGSIDYYSAPIKTTFTFKGKNSCTVNYEKERVRFYGRKEIGLLDHRYIDFSDFVILLSDNIKTQLDSFEFRIYTILDSDLIVRNNRYTCVDIDLWQYSINHYEGVNDYRFYISNDNGMIYESYMDGCDDELLPFFIPFSINQERFEFEAVIYDVGLNSNTYIYNGFIDLSIPKKEKDYGAILNYKYEEIYSYLEGVSYA